MRKLTLAMGVAAMFAVALAPVAQAAPLPVAAAANQQATTFALVNQDTRPVKTAMIYRGRAGCQGCSEAFARMLATDPKVNWNIKYAGERERIKVNRASLIGVDLYIQPGGDQDIDTAWRALGSTAQQAVQWYVRDGGRFLGVCMGAFLTGAFDGNQNAVPLGRGTIGWNWVSGVDSYTGSDVRNIGHGVDTILTTKWGTQSRQMFFSEGSYFNDRSMTVVSTYSNGQANAGWKNYYNGRIAITGTHPEADGRWYDPAGWGDRDGFDPDLGMQLVNILMAK